MSGLRSGSIRACRAISVVRALLGLALLVRPDRIAKAASFGGRLPAAWLVRLLGGRMLAQSGLELARTSRSVVRFGAAVDAVHAASMVAVAAGQPRYRKVALVSAALAVGSAAGGLAATGRQPAIGTGRQPAIGIGRQPAIGIGRQPAIGIGRRS